MLTLCDSYAHDIYAAAHPGAHATSCSQDQPQRAAVFKSIYARFGIFCGWAWGGMALAPAPALAAAPAPSPALLTGNGK